MKAIPVHPGEIFGRLKVIKESENKRYKKRYFLVRCACGTEFEVQGASLFQGLTISCGCYRDEQIRRVRLAPDRELAALKSFFQGARCSARHRNYKWNLTFEQFKNLVLSPCYYTGKEPFTIRKAHGGTGVIKANGIDRLDSSKGYDLENCVPCSPAVNFAKGSLSKEDFLILIKEVYEHSCHFESTADRHGDCAP